MWCAARAFMRNSIPVNRRTTYLTRWNRSRWSRIISSDYSLVHFIPWDFQLTPFQCMSTFPIHGYTNKQGQTIYKIAMSGMNWSDPLIVQVTIWGNVKGVDFWIHPSKWSFWYQMKAPIFLITPVKYDMQVAADVDFKSYKRICSESSEIVVTTIITIYTLSQRFRL